MIVAFADPLASLSILAAYHDRVEDELPATPDPAHDSPSSILIRVSPPSSHSTSSSSLLHHLQPMLPPSQ